MILPIGHQERSVRRLPWVTLSLIVLCFAVFLLGDTNADSVDPDAEVDPFEQAADYWRLHAYLDAPDAIREDVAYDVLPSQRPQYLAVLPDQSPFKPATDAEWTAQQDELDRLVERARNPAPAGATTGTFFERFGLVPASPRPRAFLTHMFVHAGWLHLLGNLFLLLLAGPAIEDRWGRAGFAVFYLLSGVSAGAFFLALSGSSSTPMVGASGAIAGVLGAFAVRLWNTKLRFAYFFLLLRPYYGTFEAPAWAMLSLWFGNEVFQAWVWHSTGIASGVAYEAHVGGFAFGVAAALGLRALRYEERFVNPAVEAQLTKFSANPMLEEAMAARERGEIGEALTILRAEWQREPDDGIALAYWDAALACGQPELAADALAATVRSAARRGEHELALRHWSELADHAPGALLDAGTLLRFAPLLIQAGQRERAALALRQAADPQSALTPGQALRVVELARELDPPNAVRAAKRALASPDLHEAKRSKLEALIEELGDAAALAEFAGDEEPTAEPDPPDLPDALPWDENGEIDLARFAQAKLIEGRPVALTEDGIRLRLEEGREAQIEWSRIQAVGVAIIDGLAEKPVLLIDLLANWNETEAEALRGVRLRSDRFDPRPLVGSDGDPKRAFATLVGKVLERSCAQPLPSVENALGEPFARYDGLADYERIVLEVAE